MAKKRLKFWEQLKQINYEDLVFIDEAGVNLAMTRLYARALVGERARAEKPLNRGINVSLIGALSCRKIFEVCPVYGSVDGTTFEAFISRELIPKLWKGACIVMDNAKIHLGEMVRELIEASGAKLIYLPPYSPEFSPIENCWSKIKILLRGFKARTYKELIEALNRAIFQVTKLNKLFSV